MLHSFTKLFVHLVWSTKNRERLLTKEMRPQLYQHFLDYASRREISIEALGIQIEHVHLLISLRSDQSVEDTVKLLKGESSHWINAENLIRSKFSWQRGYGAFSVSASHVGAVKDYIKDQEEHHRTKSFNEELQAILLKYGFTDKDQDDE